MLFCHLKFNQLKRLKTVKQSQIISSILNGIMNFHQIYALLCATTRTAHSGFRILIIWMMQNEKAIYCQSMKYVLIVAIILLLYFCEMQKNLATNHIYRGRTLWHTIPFWSSALRKAKIQLSILATHLHPTLQFRVKEKRQRMKLIYLIHIYQKKKKKQAQAEMSWRKWNFRKMCYPFAWLLTTLTSELVCVCVHFIKRR